MSEIDDLRANLEAVEQRAQTEINRLRDALQGIADEDIRPIEIADFARAALKASPPDTSTQGGQVLRWQESATSIGDTWDGEGQPRAPGVECVFPDCPIHKPDIAELVERIRAIPQDHDNGPYWDDMQAAADALEQMQAALYEAAQLKKLLQKVSFRAEKAEAALSEARDARDRWEKSAIYTGQEIVKMRQRAERAEAEVARLKAQIHQYESERE